MTSWIGISFARLASTVVPVHALFLAGCLSDKTKSTEPPAACAKAGEPCTFSPGKLGLCIEPMAGKPATCQSQH